MLSRTPDMLAVTFKSLFVAMSPQVEPNYVNPKGTARLPSCPRHLPSRRHKL